MIDLTIGIPCYNEAQTIGKVVADFRAAFPHARLLVVDNASTDDTARIAREHGADVVHEPCKGKGYAVRRLFREASSDYLLMVDGDDTYPAGEAHKLLAKMRDTGGDTVCGCRVSADGTAFKTTHQWVNRFLSGLISRVCGLPCGDLFSGYRLFSRRFYQHVTPSATGFEVEADLVMQTIRRGFVQHDVEVDYRARPAGSCSKLSTWRDGARVLWSLVCGVPGCAAVELRAPSLRWVRRVPFRWR